MANLGTYEDEKLYVIDSQGEILKEISKSSRIIEKAQAEYLDRTRKVDCDFLKFNFNTVSLMGKNMKYIIKLLPYIEMTTGVLRFRNYVEFTTSKSFARAYGVEEQTARKIVAELRKQDVIHKHKSKDTKQYYVFNPFIAHSGRRVFKTLYEEFYNTEWRKVNDIEDEIQYTNYNEPNE